MSKKIIISVLVILVLLFLGFGIWKIITNNNKNTYNQSNLDNNNLNSLNLSAEFVTDDCINEWSDYAEIVEERIKSASNSAIVDENTRYLIKSVDGYIYIYRLDDDNNEILYRKTEISTEYLSAQDLDDLEVGIEVKGAKALNELIENYE